MTLTYEEYKKILLSITPDMKDWQVNQSYNLYMSAVSGNLEEMSKWSNTIKINNILFFLKRFN